MTLSLTSLGALGFFVLSLFLAGLVALGLFGSGLSEHDRSRVTRGEALTLILLFGASVATFCGLGLGYLGLFSLVSAATVLLLVSLLLDKALVTGWTILRDSRWQALDLFGLFVALSFLCYGVLQRSDEIQALRDQGVYTSTGIELARTGDFGWTDRLVTHHGFEAVSHLFLDLNKLIDGKPRFLRFPGFYVADPVRGKIVPQFLRGYEVWLAWAYLGGGPQATQCVNSVFGGLGLLAAALVVRRLWGGRVAFGVLILVATSLIQLWYARFPSNEPLIQFLLWGGLLAYQLLRQPETESSHFLPARALAVLFLPFAAATTVKFAFWPVLLVLAFEFGWATRERSLPAKTRYVFGGLLIVAAGALSHAYLLSSYYVYGAWKFSVAKLGISFEMFPVLFCGAVAAAFSLGSLGGELWERRPALMRKGTSALVWIGCTAVAAVCVWQRHVLLSGQIQDIWSNRTNLYEFSQYYGMALFFLAVVGYGIWLSGKCGDGRRLVTLLMLVGAIFIVHRNLDAVHPWATRRWLPVLVPVTALALVLATERLSRWCGRAAPVVFGALIVGESLFQVFQSPALAITPNYRGAIPQVDQWASQLTAQDLVLFHPTGVIVQYGAYLAARFDIHAYIQPDTPEGWRRTRSLVAAMHTPPPRIVYVTDVDVPETTPSALRLLGSTVLDYAFVREEVRKIPRHVARERCVVRFFEVDTRQMPDGWWTGWRPRRSPQAPPLTFSLDANAEPYLRGGFYAPTPQGDGTFYRWTNGNGRIAIGELLQFPLPSRPLRITARMHSGRETSLEVHWYLDLDKPGRASKIGTTVVGPHWTECTVEVDSNLFKPETTLELQTLRPAVPPSHRAGTLGVRVLDLRIE